MTGIEAIAYVERHMGKVIAQYALDIYVANRERPFPEPARTELARWLEVRQVLINGLPEFVVPAPSSAVYWTKWGLGSDERQEVSA